MKKPKLSGTVRAVLKRPYIGRRPKSWKQVWPALRYGASKIGRADQ